MEVNENGWLWMKVDEKSKRPKVEKTKSRKGKKSQRQKFANTKCCKVEKSKRQNVKKARSQNVNKLKVKKTKSWKVSWEVYTKTFNIYIAIVRVWVWVWHIEHLTLNIKKRLIWPFLRPSLWNCHDVDLILFCYLENVKDLKIEVNMGDLGLVGLLQGVIVLHSNVI